MKNDEVLLNEKQGNQSLRIPRREPLEGFFLKYFLFLTFLVSFSGLSISRTSDKDELTVSLTDLDDLLTTLSFSFSSSPSIS